MGSVDGVAEPPKTQELRVHGVGGSHGPRMLGFDSKDEVTVVGEGIGETSVLARRNDATVESYDWGNLTSGTGSKPFWVFLLPFTLINIAGWMHPPDGAARPWAMKGVRRLVHALSLLLTATYVFTFGVLLVDVLGYQWAGRLAANGPPPTTAATRASNWQYAGVGLGVLALAGLLLALVYTAGKSQFAFEEAKAPTVAGEAALVDGPWAPEERLDSNVFFYHPGSAKALLRLHVRVAGLCLGVVGALAVYRVVVDPLSDDRMLRSTLHLGDPLRVCSGLAYIAVGLLWASRIVVRRDEGESWARSGPAIAATLAFALVNAVASGATLLLIKQLNKWPNRPVTAPKLVGGPEVNLVDVWGGLVVLLAVLAAALAVKVVFFPGKPVDDIQPPRRSPPGEQVDGLDRSMRMPVRRARYFAVLRSKGARIALGVTAPIYVAGLVFVLWRMDWSWFPGLGPPTDVGAPFYQVGAYILPLLALVVVQLVRKGRKGARTLASTLWDIFTFWPRRFSPLAVRPYSERAVPELLGRIHYHTKHKEHPCPLVLGVHSQGSVLAFAALSPLSAEELRRTALVTYGCPISTIYAMFFPAYFGPPKVEVLRKKLAEAGDGLGWRNFYRRTDPIGGPVVAEGAETSAWNTEIPDPFPGPAQDLADTTPPRERDAPPWLRVSGHSYYLQEPVLKDWVRKVRAALPERPVDPGR